MKNLWQLIVLKVNRSYKLIKELDEIPLRNFQGEFFEEKKKTKLAPRKNPVTVAELRPKPRSAEES